MNPKTRFVRSLFLCALICSFPGVHRLAARGQADESRALTSGGIVRTYVVHIPARPASFHRPALVIVLHGAGGTGMGMVKMTRGEFDSLADRDGALVAYPDGIDRHWNDGRSDRESNIDDVGFLTTLMDTLLRMGHGDPRRVYVTGMSNGAMMTYRMGCERSRMLAAIAPVDGGIPEELAPRCSPEAPLPVLAINNVDDPLVHWSGGEVTGPFGMKKLGRVLSPEQSVEFWVTHNACAPTPVVTEEPDADPKDGTRVRREYHGHGEGGTEVILYAIEGGGHTWPGGSQYLPAFIVGKTSRDIDACSLIWRFFMEHVR